VNALSTTISAEMTEPEVEALMAELRAFCKGARDRHRALARELDVREDVLEAPPASIVSWQPRLWVRGGE